MSASITGLEKLRRRLKAAERQVQREAAGALGEATTELEKEIKGRVFPARRVNQQDAPGGNVISLAGRSPVSTTIKPSRGEAVVRVARHWTPARTAAVRGVFQAAGLGAKLERRGLIVRGEFLLFSREPGLARWAHRPEKGSQYLRHVVRLSDPAVISRLQVKPAVAQAFPRISKIWQRAARRTFQS